MLPPPFDRDHAVPVTSRPPPPRPPSKAPPASGPPPGPTRVFGRGWVRDDPAKRAKLHGLPRLTGARAGRLPPSAHLFTNFFSPEDQNGYSACVGYALQQALNLRLAYVGTPAPPFSQAAIYAYARMLRRSQPHERLIDEGCQPIDAVAGMAEFGVTYASEWTLTDETVNQEPPFDVAEKASGYIVTGVYAIHNEGSDRVQDIMHALASGYPVVFGTVVDEAFMRVVGKQVIGPAGDRVLGGHMLCFIGYDQQPDGSVVMEAVNQYGASWGDYGRFYANEDFVTDPRLGDLTVITVGPRQVAGAKHEPMELEGLSR